MPSIEEVVSSFTPLTRSANEWHGACLQCDGALSVIGDRWRCSSCSAHDAGDDAAAFLMLAEGLDRAEAEAQLTNGHGRTWTPALIVPPRKPPKWGLHRVADDPRVVLIVDDRAAAKAAQDKLSGYLVCCWPDGGSRWDGLEPLRGRSLLLWPSIEGLAHMERLEAVLADPRGLACTGSFIVPSDLAPWDAETDQIIKWAKERKRSLTQWEGAAKELPAGGVKPPFNEILTTIAKHPEQTPSHHEPAQQVADGVSALQSAEAAQAANAAPEAPLPPALASPADAGLPLDAAPPIEFPPEASLERPKRPRRRLQVVGGDAIDAMESIDPDAPPLPHELSESGIAEHFVMLHRDKFRTVFEWSGRHGPCWMAWNASRWVREPNRITAMQDARTLGHGVKFWQAARGVAELSKVKWESKKFLGSMLDLASYAPEFVTKPEQFDADPFQLGTPAGTVDLRSGKLIEAEREHYITRQTSVAPEPGPHPLFDDVIRRASGGEQDIAEYLWRWLGYLLTGSVKEKAFLYLHGKTDSGKTTLAAAIAGILGDCASGGYAAQCDIEMFTETKLDKGNDRIAHLAGARFAYASEMEEGRNFKTALLKLATGGDTLQGRFLYAEKFSFAATHKLWIFGNHQMHMKSSDSALLNRLHLLEYKDAFIVTPEERDTSFQDRLRAEYPAILASMIRATVQYLDCGGLGRPERISVAVDEYASNEDTLGQWIVECLDQRIDSRASASEAYQSYSKWVEREGGYAPSAKRFRQQLTERGFGRARSASGAQFVGFTVKLGANL